MSEKTCTCAARAGLPHPQGETPCIYKPPEPDDPAIVEVAKALHRAWCPTGTSCSHGRADFDVAVRAVREIREITAAEDAR